jgi:hypothetical protein
MSCKATLSNSASCNHLYIMSDASTLADVSGCGSSIRYTVVARDVSFTLSKAQISLDSPNSFTAAFLGEFSEAESHSVNIDTDPGLFKIIVDYLSGYDILPLDAKALPHRMTMVRATRYLAKDADYLGLNGLQALLLSSEEILPDPVASSASAPVARFHVGRPLHFSPVSYPSSQL